MKETVLLKLNFTKDARTLKIDYKQRIDKLNRDAERLEEKATIMTEK